MPPVRASHPPSLDALLDLWRLSNRLTIYFIEHLPDAIWAERIPYAAGDRSTRTVRSVCCHLHNCRCWWVGKHTGRRHGIRAPKQVDGRKATRKQVLAALPRSGRAMEKLITFGLDQSPQTGGRLPNFPLSMMHFVTYHASHEAHHRGQLATVARQLGHKLPADVQAGLWQWNKRVRDA